jgi:hypothetical protein
MILATTPAQTRAILGAMRRAVVGEDLETLRRRYGIPPLEPRYAALGEVFGSRAVEPAPSGTP